jgi:hypothetical protein
MFSFEQNITNMRAIKIVHRNHIFSPFLFSKEKYNYLEKNTKGGEILARSRDLQHAMTPV